MNPRHLATLVWLRWRLALADLRRMGKASRIIIGLLATLVVLTSLGGFVLTLILGSLLIPKAQADHLLILGDILAASFLFFWLIGFLSELQRSEPFSLEKLLHLPISLRGAFLLNYFSSFASLTMIAFLPAMVALCIALPIALGWRMLAVTPLTLGFLLLTTAVTFQIRGWLATLMSTPRRRRRVMVILTTLLVFVFQIPNLAGWWIRHSGEADAEFSQLLEEQKTLTVKIAAEDISTEEREQLAERQAQAAEDYEATQREQSARNKARILRWLKQGHLAIPFGWFPYGIYRAAEGAIWPAILGTFGLVGLAATSLHFSYQSTMRFYRQAGTAAMGKKRTTAEAAAAQQVSEPAQQRNALRKPFPGVPLKPGMIARANYCCLLRAPEVKMQLLAPVLVTILLAFPLYSKRKDLPAAVSPVAALGMLIFANLASVNLVFNQFGYDRHAFQSYMLLPVSGRDLMLGKNLSLAPFSCGISLLAVIVARVLFPVPLLDLLTCVPAALSVFLICVMLGNVISIRFPLPVSASAMRKSSPGWKSALAQFMTVMFLPILLMPVVFPMALQAGLRYLGWFPHVPLALLLELVVLAGAVCIYWQLLPVSGQFLRSREQLILQEVTRRDE